MPRADSGARRRPLRIDRGLLGWVAAALATVLLTALIPLTTSAFTATVTDSRNTAQAKGRFTCADVDRGEQRRGRAYFQFAFDEPAGASTAQDSSDSRNAGTYQGAMAKDAGAPVACPNDSGGAYVLDGSSSRVTTAKPFGPIRTSFSVETWFKTSGTGRIMGFQSTSDGGSSNYDKHLYVNTSGRLVYGIFNGATQTLTTGATVNDGVWHHAVGTTSPEGSVLYLDGQEAAHKESFTTAEDFSGYWRIGQGNLGAWPDVPSDYSVFAGSLRFAAAYPYVLSAKEVAAEYAIGAPGGGGGTPSASASETATPVASASATAQPSASTTVSQAPVTEDTGTTRTARPVGGEETASTASQGPDINTSQ